MHYLHIIIRYSWCTSSCCKKLCVSVSAGNVFVIAAILLERNLQNVANYLILSLAVADLLVACLVMPLGAVYEVSREWTLGPELCDMWTSSDVLCCTASILHLVAIALDRFATCLSLHAKIKKYSWFYVKMRFTIILILRHRIETFG